MDPAEGTQIRKIQKLIERSGEMHKGALEDEFIEIASSHQSSGIRRSAIVALRKLKSIKAPPLLISILTTEFENENLRESAIKALGEVGDEETVSILRELVLLC